MNLPFSITTKLTLLFVLFAVLLLVGIGALAYTNGRAALESATISGLLSTAIEKEAALGAWVEEHQTDISALANSFRLGEEVTALIAAEPASAQAQAAHDRLVNNLQTWTQLGEQYLVLMVIEAETGQVIAATDPGEEGKFQEDRPFFINGKQGPYVQNIYNSITLQDLAMTAAAPIRSAEGQVVAVLAGRLNLAKMNAIINRRTSLHQTDDAYLVNTANLFVTQPRFITNPAVLRRGAHSEAVRRCLAPGSGVLSAEDYRGVPVINVYRWMPDRQLCLIVKIDQAEALASTQAFGQTILLVGGLVLLAASAVAAGLARTITRPVLALQAGATRLGQGELAVRLPETSGDELGQLACQFNLMAATLAEKESQLRRYTKELEQLVWERTDSLRQNQAQLQAILDHAPALISTKDLNGNITLINKRFEEVITSSPQAFVGKNIYDLFPHDVADELWQNDLAARSGPIEAEETVTHKDGSVHTYLSVKFPLHRPDTAQLFGTCAISTDITERRQAEVLLRESEQLYRTIGEKIPYGVWFTDATGYCTYVSDSFLELVGMTLEQIQQFGWLHLLPPEDVQPTQDHWLQCVQTGADFEREHRFCTPDGGYRYVLAIGRPVRDKQGQITSWVGLNLDITARKQAEEEIRQLNAELEGRVIERTAQLEAANKELEAFAYSVSHDLRAPLRGIDGWSLALLEDYYDRLDEPGREYLDFVRAEAQRMGQLIDDLLQLSRLSRAEMQKKSVDLSVLARRVVARLQVEQPDRQVTVEIQPDLTAHGDAALLEVVLSNLLGNAWKFTGTRDEARVEFGRAEEAEHSVFFVRDNGVGFDMAYAQKLFGAFQRMHKASKFPGTGIGLATVQRIIHRHGGQVWAEAYPAQGATFYFTL